MAPRRVKKALSAGATDTPGCYIYSATDIGLVLTALQKGLLTPLRNRLSTDECKTFVKSGWFAIYNAEECGIARWRDRLNWSSGQRDGFFTVYVQSSADRKTMLRERAARRKRPAPLSSTSSRITMGPLCKRMTHVCVADREYTLISYYDPMEIEQGNLPCVSEHPFFAQLPMDNHIILNTVWWRTTRSVQLHFLIPTSPDQNELSASPPQSNTAIEDTATSNNCIDASSSPPSSAYLFDDNKSQLAGQSNAHADPVGSEVSYVNAFWFAPPLDDGYNGMETLIPCLGATDEWSDVLPHADVFGTGAVLTYEAEYDVAFPPPVDNWGWDSGHMAGQVDYDYSAWYQNACIY